MHHDAPSFAYAPLTCAYKSATHHFWTLGLLDSSWPPTGYVMQGETCREFKPTGTEVTVFLTVCWTGSKAVLRLGVDPRPIRCDFVDDIEDQPAAVVLRHTLSSSSNKGLQRRSGRTRGNCRHVLEIMKASLLL